MTDKEPTVITTRAPMEMAASAPSAPPVDRLGPGTRIAGYELLEYVGGGGMARVFRARDTVLARIVALKVLSPEQTADGEVLLRFRNEAQTAARLNHESVVQVYHSGEDRGVAYIVFEFIEGLNIRALVEKKGILPLSEAISYTFQVAEALAHAAARNVVHRDIKPSNILITSDGQAKLIDLGLARLQKTGGDADELTASGVTLGTFDYISPEQARDPRTADVRSDIYSLGCTLFFMLTGRPPFVEGTVLQKLLQHQGEEPPDVRQFRPELPPETSRLLRKMMAKDPRRRFQSPLQLLDALTLLAEEIGLQPAGPAEGRSMPYRPPEISLLQRHLPWIAPTSVLAITVLVLNFVWSPSRTPSDPPRWLSAAEQPATPPEPQRVPSPEPSAGSGASTLAGPAEPPAPKPESVIAPDQADPSQPVAAPGTDAPPAVSGAAKSGPIGLVPSVASIGGSAGNSVPRADSGAAGSPAAAGGPLVPSSDLKTGTVVGVKVVDPTGSGAGTYPTLAAACAAAVTGDVLTLRFNGPIPETPLTLRNLKLTVRAAEGYQPVIVFRPADWGPMQRPSAMLSLSGGQLTMIHVGMVLEVPREASSDQWSLLESRPAEMIRLEKCWLSVNNTSAQLGAYHPDVAFIRVKSGPGAGAVMPRESTAAPSRVAIELVDCVLRGEAVVLWTHDQLPVRFSWDNGLLATSERLFIAVGGERPVSPGETVQMSLAHVTASTRAGLCRFASGATGTRQLPAQVDCRNSILIGGPSAPLVEHADVPDFDAARQSFNWNGERNFYEGFGNFWTIRPTGASAETMSADTWREHWGPQRENAPNWGRVQWKQYPPADRPTAAHVPADYLLSPAGASANPAIGAANDGRDVGCLFDRLPTFETTPLPGPASPPATSADETTGPSPYGTLP